MQRWRVPKNPISNVRSDNKEDFDFLIAAPFAEKVTHKVAQLIREGKRFAVLIAVDLLPQIKVTKAKESDKVVEQALLSMPTILIARGRGELCFDHGIGSGLGLNFRGSTST